MSKEPTSTGRGGGKESKRPSFLWLPVNVWMALKRRSDDEYARFSRLDRAELALSRIKLVRQLVTVFVFLLGIFINVFYFLYSESVSASAVPNRAASPIASTKPGDGGAGAVGGPAANAPADFQVLARLRYAQLFLNLMFGLVLTLSVYIAFGGEILDTSLALMFAKHEKKLEDTLDILRDMGRIAEITDEDLVRKWADIKEDARRLAKGTYQIEGVNHLYLSDCKNIRRLKEGDYLRSLTYLSRDANEIKKHLSDDHFQDAIEAYKNAARAVGGKKLVLRLYAVDEIPDEEANRIVETHFASLKAAGVQVKTITKKQAYTDRRHVSDYLDFVIFGDAKVTIGYPDGHGLCERGRVLTDGKAVQNYITAFKDMWEAAKDWPAPASTCGHTDCPLTALAARQAAEAPGDGRAALPTHNGPGEATLLTPEPQATGQAVDGRPGAVE